MKTPPLLTVERLKDWLTENTVEYSRIYQTGMGVKGLEISGALLRDMPEHSLGWFWGAISRALPDDAAFVRWQDSSFVLQGISSNGMYCDTYVLLLGSLEWTPVKDGEPIPSLVAWVDKDKVTIEDKL